MFELNEVAEYAHKKRSDGELVEIIKVNTRFKDPLYTIKFLKTKFVSHAIGSHLKKL